MSPKTMRVLFVNICALLVAFSVIQAKGGSDIIPNLVDTGSPSSSDDRAVDATSDASKAKTKPKTFLEAQGHHILDLMKHHFDLSMNYLLTSKQYGSQYVQRPGMAKFLNEASSFQWEEGMGILNKFFQRGGRTDKAYFESALQVKGEAKLTRPLAEETIDNQYLDTLKDVLKDSKDLTEKMNRIHFHSAKRYRNGGDAEIAHYFDDKLEKEAEVTREITGHITTLEKMSELGIALNMFDSDL